MAKPNDYAGAKHKSRTGRIARAVDQLRGILNPCRVNTRLAFMDVATGVAPKSGGMPFPVRDYLSNHMVKLRINNVYGIKEYRSNNAAKTMDSKPFVRVHVIDLANYGRWLEKPTELRKDASVYCLRRDYGSVATQVGQMMGAQSGGDSHSAKEMHRHLL